MGKYNDLAAENRTRSYLGEGHHDVTIAGAELKLGDDARPSWATKSISFRFENDEGVMFWDCELEPLTRQDGTENEMSVTIGMGNLENMGLDFDTVDSATDYSRQVEQWVMNGGWIGAKVRINVIEKESTATNPNTGKPYVNRNVYVNELYEAGQGATTNEPEAVTF